MKIGAVTPKKITEENMQEYSERYHKEFHVGDTYAYRMPVMDDKDEVMVYACINSANIDNMPTLYFEYGNVGYAKRLAPYEFEQFKKEVFPVVLGAILEHKEDFEPAVCKYAEELPKAVMRFTRASKEHEFEHFDYPINGSFSLPVGFSSYESKPKSIDDVDYFFAYGDAFCGAENIWEFAENIVYAQELMQRMEHNKNEIFRFFEREILPIMYIPHDNLTEEQRMTLGEYSDWHKDCFGHRPRGGAFDECLQAFLGRGELEREYANYARTWGEQGKPCPLTFEDYEMESDEREVELAD